MADHGRAADHKGKGKELATTSSPSTSTYNVHFVRLALQRVGGRTNLTHRDTFYRTLASMHAYKGRKFKIPIHQEGHLDLHRLLLEVISRGGMRKVEKEGLLEEVRDIISPSISVCYMLDLYHWFLLHYCEDFITENSQNTDASQPSSTQRTQLAHGGLEPWRPAISNPVTYDEEFRSNSHSTDPPMRLPDRSSPLWGMADELLTQAQTTVSQQRERNIRSALPPSSNYFAQSISSARPVAVQGAKTQAVSPQQRELNVSLSQLSSSTERSQNYADRLQNLPPTAQYPIPMHQNSAIIGACVKLLVNAFCQADTTGNQSISVLAQWGAELTLTLPEAQIAPISQEINSLPIEDLPNAQKKQKASMEDPTHQPNTQMIAEQVGNLREAGKDATTEYS